ncbi:MAG: type VII secretion target [Microbacterium sp.]
MTDLRIDTERVRSVGTGLARIAHEFENASVHSDQIAASVGHEGLADAVRSFAHAWDDTRSDMTESIKGLGEATTAIADTFEQADHELAAAMDGTSTVAPAAPGTAHGSAVPR